MSSQKLIIIESSCASSIRNSRNLAKAVVCIGKIGHGIIGIIHACELACGVVIGIGCYKSFTIHGSCPGECGKSAVVGIGVRYGFACGIRFCCNKSAGGIIMSL